MPAMDNEMYDLIVIGGGASGLMAAGVAAERGASVLVLEKNKDLGKKLKITGGGRCNIYNAEFDTKKLLENYGDAKKYLYSPFAQFAAEESKEFFHTIGLHTVVQARKRAFPYTEKAYDVFKVLEDYCKKHKVEFRTNTPITRIDQENGEISGVLSKKERFYAKNYILSTGGHAAPETGSTGDGFKFLEKLGHTIHKPSPNIVPLVSDAQWIHRLAGTSLSFMKIRFIQNGKTQIRKTGKVLLTHFGISGPLILNSAREVKDLLQGGPVTASIDLFPDTELELLAMLKTDIADIDVNEVSKESRKELAHLCKNLEFPITGTLGWDKAVIADGGVHLDEVDFKTMQSRKFPNLYLLGDILHINRPSGGFSLQLCWTTAWVAGQSIPLEEIKRK